LIGSEGNPEQAKTLTGDNDSVIKAVKTDDPKEIARKIIKEGLKGKRNSIFIVNIFTNWLYA
jgi:hypothetical protein